MVFGLNDRGGAVENVAVLVTWRYQAHQGILGVYEGGRKTMLHGSNHCVL